MNKIILWSSITLSLSAFVLSCAKTDKLGDRVSALEKEVAALEESVGQLNSNAVVLHKVSSGSYFLKDVARHDYGYALEFTDGTVCDVFFGAEAPTKDPLLSVDENGQWLVSMDGGKQYSPIEGASNAFSQNGHTPRFRVENDQWQVSVDGGLSWTPLAGSPSDAISFFQSVVYNEVAGLLTLVLSDGRAVSISVLDPCSILIQGYQSGENISPGKGYEYLVEMTDVAEIIPRIPSGWHVAISDDRMTVTAPSDAAEGEVVLTLILVSGKGLVKQVALPFTVVSEE